MLQEVEEKEIVNLWEKPCGWPYFVALFCATMPATASFSQNKAEDDPASAERGDHDQLP